MKHILFFLVIFLWQSSLSQDGEPTYIAISDVGYCEIHLNKNEATVVRYYIEYSKLKRDTLKFDSLKKAHDVLGVNKLIKTKKLEKESRQYLNTSYKNLQKVKWGDLTNKERLNKNLLNSNKIHLGFKTQEGITFSLLFYESGNKELFYLSGDKNLDVSKRFFCKSIDQPVFVPIEHKDFDVVLMQKNDNLSLIFFDKKKGIQGEIRF